MLHVEQFVGSVLFHVEQFALHVERSVVMLLFEVLMI